MFLLVFAFKKKHPDLFPADPNESSPTILDSFQAGEVHAGQSVELPCIAGGYPNPTVRWLKDGRPLPSDARWTRRLTGLTISDLRQEDSGSYACEVTNSFGSKEVSGQLHVIGTSASTARGDANKLGELRRPSFFSADAGLTTRV